MRKVYICSPYRAKDGAELDRKAEFGFNNAAEQFRKSYDALKMRLSLSAEYNTAPQVSETDTNSTESGV